jgi:Squalene-hopene cyclase C-terminal domain/Prenyltransferase and squalene oxidase repeat
VGLNALAAVAAALALGGGLEDSARYLETRQQPSGAFAEPGAQPSPGLTAWAVLGLRAAGRSPRELEPARAYLERTEASLTSATDLELVLVARAALGERPAESIERVRGLGRANGAIGPTVNSTIWGILALRATGQPAPAHAVRFLLRRQHRSGGWSWSAAGAPDSNDTAAAVQALRCAAVRGPPIRRAVSYLRRLQDADGGFELTPGRGSDVQSTAWAIQAFLAAGERPGAAAYRYLARLRRPDGSLRYSARYAVTPVWVTAQALAALAGKPLPLGTP